MKAKNYILNFTLCLITLFSVTPYSFAQTPGMSTNYTINVGGTIRSYRVYVSSLYDGSKPVPLMLNIHGFTLTMADQEQYMDFRKIADTANFITVAPQGINNDWSQSSSTSAGQADRDFLWAMIDSIKKNFRINPCKIYTSGYSKGGFMSYILSINVDSPTKTPVIAAMGSVAGGISTNNSPNDYWGSKKPTHPTPIMEIHGDNDATIGYTGNSLGQGQVNVDTLIKYWVTFNHCTTPAVKTTLPDNPNNTDNSSVEHYVYSGGDRGSSVEFYKILNGGHTVPTDVNPAPTDKGNGERNTDFNAALVIWQFCSKYCLPYLTSTTCTTAPTISSQPNSKTICTGTSTSFSVTANGCIGTALTYQWQVNTGTGTTFTNLTNSAPYNGVTTNSLTVTSATTALSNYQYRCFVTSCCDNAYSNSATLTVNSCSSLTAAISGGTTVCQNATAPIITFTGSGGTPPYTFVYTLNGGSNQVVSTGSTATVAASTATANTYTYALVSIQDAGSTNAQSGNQIITVYALPTITGTTPASRCDAGMVTLGATPSAGTINWYDVSTGGSSLAAGTSYSPSIPSTTTYYVDATNAGCTTATRTAVTATVTTTPSTPTVSSNSPVCTGSPINLTSSTVSNATYSWAGPNSFTSASPTPTIASATTAMAGTYSVTVTLNNCTSAPGTTSVTVTSSVTPSVIISADNNTICTGQLVTFTATPVNGGIVPTYVWSVNSGTVSTTSTYSSSTLNNGDIITCVLTSSSGCANPLTASSNTITMTVTGQLTPSVIIASTSGVNTTCAGTVVTFTATPTNGGPSPGYQWMVDGANAGTNSPIYAASVLNGQLVSCILSSSLSCVSPSTASSNTITMSVTNTVTPTVSIAINSGSNTICAGTAVTFTATATNGGATPTYVWSVNGGTVGTTNTYTSSGLNNGDVITCVLTSDASCVSTATVSSNTITMSVTPTVTPSVSISISNGTNPACAGSSITFTAAPINGGAIPAYVWSVNAGTVGNNSNTFTSSTLNNGDVISCVLTSNANCSTTPTATSNTIPMSITTNSVLPSVTIVASTNSICAGTAVTFTATPTNAGTAQSYLWMVGSNTVGTNSNTYTDASLTNGQVVTCSMTTTLSCGNSTAASNGITMNVTNTVTPAVSISITEGSNPTCAGQLVTFLATPTNGGTAPTYIWSVNGGTVGTTNTYSSSALANADVVTCVLTSNANCKNTVTAMSSGITMTTTAVTAPSITIGGPNSICAGVLASFTAQATNGGANPTYQWMVGSSTTGTNSATFSTSSLTNGQQISCTIVSASSCASAAPVASNTITVNVTPIATPAVSIAVTSGSNQTAAGQSITFTASPTNGGPSPTYQWKVNGTNVLGTGNTYTSSTFTSGDVVSCVLTSDALCASTTTVTSNNTITVTIIIPATISNTTVHVINTAMAKVKSNVTGDGGSPITIKGTVWSTSPSPTTALATKTILKGGTGAFTDTITGLLPATTYYVRTYATNANGTVYSNEIVYTTPPVNTCSPDPSITLATPGIFPKSLPPADTSNLTIHQTFTYSIPFTYTNSNGEAVVIDSSFLTGIINLPSGLSYQCGRPNCIFYPGEIGCFVVSGTLPKSNNLSYSTEFTVTDYGVIHTKKYGDQVLETYSPNHIADTTVFVVGNGGVLGVEAFDPNSFGIVQYSPNPFSDMITIKFSTPQSGKVDFYINDLYGREVYREVVYASSGINTITYYGNNIAAGSYYFTLSNNTQKITKMIIAIK